MNSKYEKQEQLHMLSESVSNIVSQLMLAYRVDYQAPIKIPGTKKLTPLEVDVLSLLEWDDNVTIKEIVEILDVANSTVTSAVNRLEGKGIVYKVVLEEDKRSISLKLTHSGLDMIRYNRYRKSQFISDVLVMIEEEDRVKIASLLERVNETYKLNAHERKSVDNMNALDKEFHYFGPWLMEVNTYNDIPHHYLEKMHLILESNYCFKVPVMIDRRKAYPGMLLYNTIVCVRDNELVILKWRSGGVVEKHIGFDDIKYVEDHKDLLNSHIMFATEYDQYDIEFSSVSEEISGHVMKMIRGYVYEKIEKIDINRLEEIEVSRLNVEKDLISKELFDSTYKVIAYQPSMSVEKMNPSTAEMILHSYDKYQLQDIILLSDGKELVLVNRLKDVKRKTETDYSIRHIYMKMREITGVFIEEDIEMKGLKILTISLGEMQVIVRVGDKFDLEDMRTLIEFR